MWAGSSSRVMQITLLAGARMRRVLHDRDSAHVRAAPVREVARFPYVPSDETRLDERCREVYQIQVQGLARRMEATGIQKPVIGVSSGLDSTQALIVAAKAVDQLGLPRSNVLAYALPGLATSERTRGNAWRFMQALNVTGSQDSRGGSRTGKRTYRSSGRRSVAGIRVSSQVDHHALLVREYANSFLTGKVLVMGTGHAVPRASSDGGQCRSVQSIIGPTLLRLDPCLMHLTPRGKQAENSACRSSLL